MKYLLLCCHEEKKVDSMPKSECDALMQETIAYCEALKKSGHLLAVEQLEPIKTAMSVKVRNGKVSVTDGPFAETKEQLGGFFLISARDLNEALQVASSFRRAVWDHGGAAGQGHSRKRPRRGFTLRNHPASGSLTSISHGDKT